MINQYKGGSVMKKVAKFVALLAAIAVMASCGVAHAAWPEGKVTIVWHSSAGSAGDLLFRALAKFMEVKTKVPFIVENITGASGANAWTRTARAKPDGSTLQGVSSTFIASPVQNNMSVNYTSFDPVVRLFIDPLCIYTAGDSPYKTLEEFFAEAKKRPGELSATAGTAGSLELFSTRQLMKEAGVDVAFVPFEGGGEGLVAVMGGHVTVGVGEYAEVASTVAGGKIRVLATFNKIETLDVPSVAELGYKTKLEKFRGVIVPKGTPQAIKDSITALLKEAMEDPELKVYYANNHLIPAFALADEFYKAMEAQTEEVKAIMADSK